MEILIIPIALLIAGYVAVRVFGRNVVGDAQQIVFVLGFLAVVALPLLGLLALVSQAGTGQEALNGQIPTIIESAVAFLADHIEGVVIGLVTVPVAGLLIAWVVKPMMDAFRL